ncbi:AAA family ATPase (plasmid) [Pseudomonas putida]|uniref:TniB family NTP-binding protein n=1 Tax=Pseudomonas putida TaxID=303 RepID=UPI001BAE5B4F|nr:TniB family NTP-binding protein [Pseudomonas putida]QUG92791.1 AAA family ATPase [Pseudomonas putida]
MMNSTEQDAVLKQFNHQIVIYPTFDRAHAQLKRAIRATELRGEPSCALLYGPSGSGKSKLCKIFRNSFDAADHSIEVDGKYRNRPAFYCTVPTPVTVKSFLKSILARLGHPNAAGDAADMNYELIQSITTAKIKVMIFDEFQRLTKREAEKARQLTIDWLVALLNEIHIPIIICGTTECLTLLGDAPLARRYPYLANLDYLSFSEREHSEFVLTLRGLDDAIYNIAELESGVHFHDMSICAPLYAATRGNLEYLRHVLHFAIERCLSRGDRALQRQDLIEACQCIRLPLNLSLWQSPFEISHNNCMKLIIDYETKTIEIAAQKEAAIRSFST